MSEEITRTDANKVPAPTTRAARWSYTPDVDVLESPDGFTVVADLPGVSVDHLDIAFENGVLRLHGRAETRRPPGLSYLAQEYGVGDYDRTLNFGDMIEVDGIAAELTNGVLTVHLPKSASARPRRIDIQTK